MEVQNLGPDQLVPYDANPRDNEHAVEAVAKSIQTYGFRQPIVVDKDRVVVAGHTRLMAAQRLGLESVPVVIADDLTPEQARAFRVADNQTATKAKWDKELLVGELVALEAAEVDMDSLGFHPKQLERLLATEEELQPDLPAIFQIVITCKDDAEQESVYEHCMSEGYDCKVLTL